MLELHGDLFKSPYLNDKDTKILHCISADYTLGAGFAAEIEKRYHIREFLKVVGKNKYPDIIAVDQIINLVTKEKYFMKPTFENFNKSLIMVREYCLEKGITRLIMPKIGSGLDRLDWKFCKDSIKYIVDEFDIDCVVYFL